ncbi:MAG: hypothetical protein K0R54_5509 [Clostridiaceae bacterium]|jgi:uncharacterized protein YjdB|nr:hypothetical protein [Clostridiaceae bacterium]
MIKRRKRIMAEVLVLTMCTSIMPATIAFASDTSTNQAVSGSFSNEADFTIDSTTGSIIKYIGTDSNVVIPSTINGIAVKGINMFAFARCSGITSISIPEGVMGIGEKAFEGCSSLLSVTLPSTLMRIGTEAFENCTSLISITIPDNITVIDQNTFTGCSSLTNVNLPSKLTQIKFNAFSYCSSLTSITIPKDVSSIEEHAFPYCTSLEKIIVDDNNQYYKSDDGVLFNKTKTELVTYPSGKKDQSYVIPDGVKSINASAFFSSNYLTSITIPSSVESIGSSAFSDSKKLASITIPGTVKTIGTYTFYKCDKLTDAVITNGIQKIPDSMFRACGSLKNVTIPNSVTYIDEYAFEECTGLTDLVIPTGVKSIGNGVFDRCSALTNLTFSSGLTSLGDSAFSNCTGLKRVEIPNTVTSIGNGAFVYCGGLQSVIIPSSVTSIGTLAFDPGKPTLFYVSIQKTKDLLINIGIQDKNIILNGQVPTANATQVLLNQSNLNCIVGDHKTLTATTTPNAVSVTWSSSNNYVAKVDTIGNVDAVGQGSAVITCAATDGSGAIATCNVNVANTIGAAVSITNLSLNASNFSLNVGDSKTLTTTIAPTNATNKNLTWKTSDGNVVTVDQNGNIKAVGAGTAIITCSANDGSGKLATATIAVSAGNNSNTNNSGNNGNNNTSTTNNSSSSTNNSSSSTNNSSTNSGSNTTTNTNTNTAATTNSSLDSVYISGTEEVHHKLRAKVRYSGTEPSFQYQWLKASEKGGDYSDISGADDDTYTLKGSDRNKYIKVIVTATINGRTYTVEDKTGKIDSDSSNDDKDDDNGGINLGLSNSTNLYDSSNPSYGNTNTFVGKTENFSSTYNENPSTPRGSNNIQIKTNGILRDPSGRPVSGWVKGRVGKWYYLDQNGFAKTGWINFDNKWYYLNSLGEMVTNTVVDGYTIGADGVMV